MAEPASPTVAGSASPSCASPKASGWPAWSEHDAHSEAIRAAFPFCGYIEGAEHRAIQLRQLQRFSNYSMDNCESWQDSNEQSPTHGQMLSEEVLNLYHVNEFLILPATREDSCSCVELVTDKPQDPNWFVSHWWGERIVEFMKCLECYVRTKGLPQDAAFWICAFANRQHNIDADLGQDPRSSSFYRALEMSRGLLLMLDAPGEGSAGTTPFTRSWCTFEVSMAVLELKKPIDIASYCKDSSCPQIITESYTDTESKTEKKTPGWGSRSKASRENTFPIEVMAMGLDVEIEAANATEEIDRVRILNCIAGHEMTSLEKEPAASHDNYRKVNLRLRAVFALAMWFQVIQKDGIVDPKRLARALAADEWRKALVMNFGFCLKLDDHNLGLFAAGIPSKLIHLELHFWMCDQIGNAGLKALAKALPEGLETLTLNFQLCKKIGQTGVDALGFALPEKLVSLRLSFEFDIVIRNVFALAKGISNLQNLRVLDLDFGGIDNIDDRQVAGLADGLPPRLKNLYLCLRGCHFLTSQGVHALAKSLPAEMTVLNLNFSTCDRINNEAARVIAQTIPNSLKVFHISFQGCTQIDETSIALLVQKLPPSLHGAKINLIGTKASEEVQRACRRLETMQNWIIEGLLFITKPNNVMNRRRRSPQPRPISPGPQGRNGWSPTMYDNIVRYAGFTSPTTASTARFNLVKSPRMAKSLSGTLFSPTFERVPTSPGALGPLKSTLRPGSQASPASPGQGAAPFPAGESPEEAGKDLKRCNTAPALKSSKGVLPKIDAA